MHPLLWAIHAGSVANAAPTAHAVVIGSNRPGPGQKVLRHAIDDAERMAEVLSDLGGLDPAHVYLLRNPDPADILATLAGVRASIATSAALGEPSSLTFYYSGHARSTGLSLGAHELDLATLRGDLEAIDADVTLVVLDACQSGAFSTAKGIAAAEDFSHSSLERLTTTGIAVIASSSEDELSQESPDLGGSFFTHHLITGMRGAADEDLDGLITLSEAYRYASHRTLIDTAVTAIGSQHVTLETALSGTGELVLSRPVEATAQLVLPAEEASELLIHHEPARVVAAEVHKVSGTPMTLALVPGDYAVTVREEGGMLRCPITLPEEAAVTFTRKDCRKVTPVTATDKGGGLRRVQLELGTGVLAVPVSDYTERLTDFGYRSTAFGLVDFAALSGSVVVSSEEHLAWAATVGLLDGQTWQRQFTDLDGNDEVDAFSWRTLRLGLYPRLQAPLGRGWLVPYLQGGGGAALATTDYAAHDDLTTERFLRWHLAGAAGLQLMGRRGRLGVFTQAELIYAPLPVNLLSDRHNAGGLHLEIGLRAGS